ncbi:disulfide bond formation protein B [Sporolactobacillus shoreae]|uniref:Disulfide bond formation protein B n=1 Tax=Sporolactobacillus shoreae TaxID=1465501 RepID=A0A4Z0GTC2_9BACL|nr:disulfide bond formation protein B [Sporolactobacillus shoreae]TGA99914.1 disulfide bond formation protein B [Sporolactobacillus shoreae]
MSNTQQSNRFFLLIAWIISLTATGGSLFFSEVMHLTPCTLCWYQRILMYPLTLSLGIAFFSKDISIKKYILPISILGFIIATHHYTIQMFPIYPSCELLGYE